MKFLLLFAVLAMTAAVSEACHGAKKQAPEGNVRKKRAVSQADARKDLSDFFTECMTRKNTPNLIPQMRSVIDFVLRDTKWYKILDNDFCSGKKDTIGCWNGDMDGLIDWDSRMLGPARECLLEYGTKSRTGGYRQKRSFQSRSQFGPAAPDPPCPQVSDSVYGSCMDQGTNNTAVFPSLENFHWESVAIFLREHFSRCRYEKVVETWNKGRIVYRKTCPPSRFKTTGGEPAKSASEQCVPFILQEVIRDESPLKQSNEECVTRFANVTIEDGQFVLEEKDELVGQALKPEEEFKKYGYRGMHNGADIVGYCDPKSTFTPWYDDPANNQTGDSELLKDIRGRYMGEKICEKPQGIQIRVARNEEPYYTSGNHLRNMSPNKGLECLDSMQHGGKTCENFKVRFCCYEPPQPSNTVHQYRKTATTVGTCGRSDKWGYWKNVDSKRGDGGDFEYFSKYGMPNCEPVAVQGRIRGSMRPYTQAHNNLRAEDPKRGIVCSDSMQPRERPCRDFEVRFCCKGGKGIVVTTVRPRTTRRRHLIIPRA